MDGMLDLFDTLAEWETAARARGFAIGEGVVEEPIELEELEAEGAVAVRVQYWNAWDRHCHHVGSFELEAELLADGTLVNAMGTGGLRR